MKNYQIVLDFWFNELSPEDHFSKNDQLDEEIRERFGHAQQQAAAGELSHWRESTKGRVAEIILLDQFSRNLFRKDGRAFSNDNMALALAQEARRQADFSSLPLDYQLFALMPYMHSESPVIHEEAVKLFSQYDEWGDNLKYEYAHKAIIDQFGRYPHRNDQIGRPSTPEEIEWLKHHDGF